MPALFLSSCISPSSLALMAAAWADWADSSPSCSSASRFFALPYLGTCWLCKLPSLSASSLRALISCWQAASLSGTLESCSLPDCKLRIFSCSAFSASASCCSLFSQSASRSLSPASSFTSPLYFLRLCSVFSASAKSFCSSCKASRRAASFSASSASIGTSASMALSRRDSISSMLPMPPLFRSCSCSWLISSARGLSFSASASLKY